MKLRLDEGVRVWLEHADRLVREIERQATDRLRKTTRDPTVEASTTTPLENTTLLGDVVIEQPVRKWRRHLARTNEGPENEAAELLGAMADYMRDVITQADCAIITGAIAAIIRAGRWTSDLLVIDIAHWALEGPPPMRARRSLVDAEPIVDSLGVVAECLQGQSQCQ